MFTLAVFLSVLISTVSVNAQACDAKNPCPASAPCCSEYGYCGSGPEFCLAGCNPLFSNSVTSCKPSPVCKSQTYEFADANRILTDRSKYDGSPDKYDWVLDGGNVEVADNNLVMVLTETNAGTRLSSTRFVHYGTITATLKTGRWDGVVVGFITMSNTRDEIDWEFPGNRVTEGQTNFFWQGQNSHGDTSKGLTDTYANWHDYTIDWSPDALVFKIDGKTVRTLKASDYGNKFPTTPSRIQLSLWPAGTSASAPGTVQWAGGMIDWKNKDYVAAGNQFRTYFKSIDVKCGDPQPPSADQITYVYAQGSNTDQQTINFSSDSPVMGEPSGTSLSGSGSTTSATSTDGSSATVSSQTGSAAGTSTSTSTPDSPAVTGNPPTVTDGASVSGGSSTTTSSATLATGSQGSASPSQGGKNGNWPWKHGHKSHTGIFQAGKTDAVQPTDTAGSGSRNSGFFGGAASVTDSAANTGPTGSPNNGASDSSSSSSTSSANPPPSDSPTPPPNGNKGGAAQSSKVGMLPVLTAAVVMTLALAF